MAFIEGKPSLGLGDIIGAQLGNSLSQRMDQLTQLKLQNIIRKQHIAEAAAGYEAAGLPPELAAMHPQAQSAYLKNYLKGRESQAATQAYGALEGEGVAEPQAGVSNILKTLQGSTPKTEQTQALTPQETAIPQAQQAQLPSLEELLGIAEPGSTLTTRLQAKPTEITQAEMMPKPSKLDLKAPSPWKVKPELIQAPKIDKRTFNAALRQASPAERRDIIKARDNKIKEVKADQIRLEKKMEPFIKDLDLKGGAAAEESDMVLNKMEKLVESGKLTSAQKYNFYKKLETSGKYIGGGLGTAIGAAVGSFVPAIGTALGATGGGGLGAAAGEMLMPKYVGSKEDQQFQKLTTHFLKNLRGIFGAKPAIQEMEAYMAGIPNLSMTDEGKTAVIHDLRLMNAAARYKKKMKDQIMKQTHGAIPMNLEEMIDERSKPYLEKIKSQFLDDGLKNIQLEF